MKRVIFTSWMMLCLCASIRAEDLWEVGAFAGYGFYRNVSVQNSSGTATTGFKSGVAFGATGANHINKWFGGEIRYTYRQNDLTVSNSATEVSFDGESHIINYDF